MRAAPARDTCVECEKVAAVAIRSVRSVVASQTFVAAAGDVTVLDPHI